MADMIDSGKISFACELDKDLETPTTESNTEARITFTETQIVLGLGNDKSIKYKATGQGTDLSNYYNKSQVDEKLELKTDKTVLENYYNKSDIDGKLTNKVDTTTLDNYDLSTEVDNKVKVVSDKVGDLSTLETGVKNTVVAAINEVKRAQTEAGKVTNLNDLGDVNASAPRRGQFLGWDQDTRKWISKDVETDGMDTHMANFSNPHRTTISNLNDTTINTPKGNQVLVYNGTKWINKDISLDDSNLAKLNATNIFTAPQVVPNATAATHAINKGQFDSSISAINTNIGSINTTLGNKVTKTGNETIAGVKTFSSSIVIPNATADKHALPLVQANTLYSKLLTKNLEWTVGTGGKFANINDALSEASKYSKVHKVTGLLITIKLKSGFVFNEKISIVNQDLSFVIIESEDSEVGINASSSVFGSSEASILFKGNYAKLPVLRIMVDLDTKSAGNKKVVFMQMHQSYGIISFNAGCKNAAWDAVMVEGGSTLFADGCIIENAGYDSIFCNQGSIVSANDSTIKGSARYGILVRLGGYVTANNAKLIDQTQGTLLQCEAGIIRANSLVTTGSTATETNITPNQLTSNGIIFK
ncbi:hypothetical protein NON42_001222 [Campylobacter coli]|nr:hypothetical protein [Campylobacter coli]